MVGEKVSQSDPIADMLTRIRNGMAVQRDWISAPSSKQKAAIVELLKNEGFILDYQVLEEAGRQQLRIKLGYDEINRPIIKGLRRVSKPGLRVYIGKKQLPKFFAGRGLSVVSTSKGLMTGREAWKRGIGGEILCYVW
ncbi:MAG: small subunit ribosomal protein S8 [Chloroflexi bacterium]|nr:MAG: small subunit ribosomal protein S8 [Chloroflexota bacterium]